MKVKNDVCFHTRFIVNTRVQYVRHPKLRTSAVQNVRHYKEHITAETRKGCNRLKDRGHSRHGILQGLTTHICVHLNFIHFPTRTQKRRFIKTDDVNRNFERKKIVSFKSLGRKVTTKLLVYRNINIHTQLFFYNLKCSMFKNVKTNEQKTRFKHLQNRWSISY